MQTKLHDSSPGYGLKRSSRRIRTLCLHISGGWLAVPVEWFDGYDRTTFNREEMEQSINATWKRFDREND